MTRRYRFVAGEDSMDALRLLRRGWAGLSLGEGEVTVRLAQGGAVRVHVDAMEIEPGFHVASVVAEVVPLDVALPDGEPLEGAFPFSDGDHDVLVFRGVSWLESLPDLGDDGAERSSEGHTVDSLVCVGAQQEVGATGGRRGGQDEDAPE